MSEFPSNECSKSKLPDRLDKNCSIVQLLGCLSHWGSSLHLLVNMSSERKDITTDSAIMWQKWSLCSFVRHNMAYTSTVWMFAVLSYSCTCSVCTVLLYHSVIITSCFLSASCFMITSCLYAIKALSLIVLAVCYVIRIGSSVHCVGVILWGY